MNRFKSYFFAIFCMLCSVFGACSDDPAVQAAEDTLTVGGIEAETTVPAVDAPQIVFTVESNRAWEIVTEELDWASVSPASGAAGSVTRVTVTPYVDKGNLRTGRIVVQAGTQKSVLTLHQHPSAETPSIIVEGGGDNAEIVCGADGMPVYFNVNANVDWTVDSSELDWASVTPGRGIAGKSVRMTLAATENPGSEMRTGTLVFVAEKLERHITVKQEAKTQYPVIALSGDVSDNYIRMGAAGRSATFEVKSNCDWTVDATKCPSWLEVSPDKGRAGETIVVTAKAAANTGESRRGVFAISATSALGTSTETLTVVQAPAEGFDWLIFADDFSWATTPTDKPFNVPAMDQGAGEKLTTLYPEVASATTDPQNSGCQIVRGYTRAGALKMGEPAKRARFTTPPFSDIDGKMDLTVTFRTLTLKDNGAELEIYCETGTYDDMDIRQVSAGQKWEDDPFQNWYDVTLRITGATRGCRLNIRSLNESKCTWYLDDVRITSLRKDAVSGVKMSEPPVCLAATTDAVSAGADGTFRITVNHTVDVTVTTPAWVSLLSESSEKLGSGTQTTYLFQAADNTTGTARAEVVRFSNAAANLSSEVFVTQEAAVSASFPIRWLLGPEHMEVYDYTSDWKGDGVKAEQGRSSARLSFVLGSTVSDGSRPGSKNPTLGIRGGEPAKGLNANYIWDNDYFLFEVPGAWLPAGQRVNIDFWLVLQATNPKYWVLEYEDGGVWKPAGELRHTTTGDGTDIAYNYAMEATFCNISETMTLSEATAVLRIRLRCVTGRLRINGKESATTDSKAMSLVYRDAATGNEHQPTISLAE